MQVSRSSNSHNPVDYFLLPNGKADVFMRKNETTELDEEGNTIYVADEIYFQVDPSITKEYIDTNFELMWNKTENPTVEPTAEERMNMLEETINFLLGI